MKDQLVQEYPKRLRSMFRDVNRHFAEAAFGGKKALIHTTVPFMILEKWREQGHPTEIPLLDEAVKNVVLATASSIFGWEKTCCLHLRVSLENILYGVLLLRNGSLLAKYQATGTLSYKRFSNLLGDFANFDSPSGTISRALGFRSLATALYDALSKWSHTLGDDFVTDLCILGYQKTDNTTMGFLRKHFSDLTRIATIAYLTAKPSIFRDIGAADQRLFLQSLSTAEKRQLRGALGV